MPSPPIFFSVMYQRVAEYKYMRMVVKSGHEQLKARDCDIFIKSKSQSEHMVLN